MTSRATRALYLVPAGLLGLTPLGASTERGSHASAISTRTVPIIVVDGLKFRDLDRDGRLTPYEDWRLSPEARSADLTGRMTLEEKAGTMMHSTLAGLGSPVGFSCDGYDLGAVRREIAELKITSFITRLSVPPSQMAEQNNAVQEIAESTRLGIPVTISTDPRNHFQQVLGASSAAGGYSQWPETLGFAALRAPDLVKRFAGFARREYRATGIHMALSPQADLFTEPRWSRGMGTFGSDPELARALVQAYVEGFQGSLKGPTRDGVLTVVKHWVAYGASPEGLDGHNYYGRYAQIDQHSLATHIRPFEGAFRAKVAGVMPTYDIVRGAAINGRPLEEVGAGFSHQLLTSLLRGKYGYKGIILSDWRITSDCEEACLNPLGPQSASVIGMPWGVEALTPLERYAKGINAGIDQFGGADETSMVVDAVRRGLVSESRINQSVNRILVSKFQLGLFENPFVDPDAATRAVGTPDARAAAAAAQAESQVLLKNARGILPAGGGARVWLRGVDPERVLAHGLIVVDRPEEADFALVRVSTPFERLHPNHFFGGRQNEGRLDYRPGNPDFDAVVALAGKTRVVIAAFTDRPAVMTQISPLADAILVNFGVSDDALLNVVTGRRRAKGRLPFELPSSMGTVADQNPARPDDSARPLFPYGAGLVSGGAGNGWDRPSGNPAKARNRRQ